MTTTTAPPITEAAFQRTVVELLRLHGWRIYHTWTAIHSPTGFPDVIACHPVYGLRFLELKTNTGRLSLAQTGWIEDLTQAGARCHVLKPRDWALAQAIARGEV
jgi:hypothetical protein